MKHKSIVTAIVGLALAAPVAYAAPAAATTIKATYREGPTQAFHFTDADNSKSNSIGDSASGRFNLLQHGRVVGVVRFADKLIAQPAPTTFTLQEQFVVTLRRQGKTRGGHLYGAFNHDEDFNAVPKVGDTEVIPIARGDGRFAGYKGQVVSRVVSVDKKGEPSFLDRLTLTK